MPAFVNGKKQNRFRNLEVRVSRSVVEFPDLLAKKKFFNVFLLLNPLFGLTHFYLDFFFVQNVRGAMPQLKLMDASGDVIEHLK